MRARGAALLLAALLLACGDAGPETPVRPEAPPGLSAEAWDRIVAAEESLHALTPAFARLSRSLRNLRLPDAGARGLFDAAVVVTDLAPALPAPAEPVALRISRRPLPLAEPAPPVGAPDVSLWRPWLDGVDQVLSAGFGVRRGVLANEDRSALETRLLFRALSRRPDGSLAWARGTVDVTWRRGGDDAWRVSAWHTRDFELVEAPRALFREVLDTALPDADDRRRARTSVHELLSLERLLRPDEFERPHRWFFLGSQDRHPAVSVVDVDGDGFDDLYVMARWGPNQLLVNRGDGTFEERAAELGLDLRDHPAAAIFADFDNDGDPDAFVGRSLAPSVYLENEGGRFVDRSASALPGGAGPALVGSLAAADVDGDGLLDVYVPTYAAQMLVQSLVERRHELAQTGVAPPERVLEDFLPGPEAERLFDLAAAPGVHEFRNLPGPPNVLLRNAGGGRFERVSDPGPLAAWRNTYQATFSDYDGDADADLYLAHDFAPNQLLRNDGAGGFRDVTEETETADIGFGMGAAWGDYDRDGRFDLYVSNMYSKAGQRITAQIDGVDPRFAKMARGNTLFRNAEPAFEHVSGLGEDDLRVEAAGWAWGGQLVDVDRDGFLDVYALSGYYTSPLVEAEGAVDI